MDTNFDTVGDATSRRARSECWLLYQEVKTPGLIWEFRHLADVGQGTICQEHRCGHAKPGVADPCECSTPDGCLSALGGWIHSSVQTLWPRRRLSGARERCAANAASLRCPESDSKSP